jgi:hypothetical protein
MRGTVMAVELRSPQSRQTALPDASKARRKGLNKSDLAYKETRLDTVLPPDNEQRSKWIV